MTVNQQVTRYPGGLVNGAVGSLFENFKHNNPSRYHQLFNDFDTFTAADWVVTATGAATEAITAGDGGQLLLQNSAANNDLVSIQYAGGTGAVSPTFLFEATKDMFFGCSVTLDDATNAAMLVGLAIADTTPITSIPVTGMYISKPAATTFPQAILQNASVGTLTAQAAVPMVSAVQIDLGLHYTASDGNCTFYMGTPGAGGAPAFGPQAAQFRLPSPLTLPVALVAPIFALQNGTAAARNMRIDWYCAAKSRVPG
jgi:hypothetical protein